MKVSEIEMGKEYVVWRWQKGVPGYGWLTAFRGLRIYQTVKVIGREGRKVVVSKPYIPALSRDPVTLKVTWGRLGTQEFSLYPYCFVKGVGDATEWD